MNAVGDKNKPEAARTAEPEDASEIEGFLFASAVAAAQSFALLAVPVHAQTAPQASEADSLPRVDAADDRNDKPADPIEETGSLAAVDIILRSGMLDDW